MKAINKKQDENNQPFEQERFRYLQIIDQLIIENEMLKKQLLILTDLKNNPLDIHRAQTKEDEGSSSQIRKPQAGENSTIEQKPNIQEAAIKTIKEEMARLNQNELTKRNQKASQYQNKIEELTALLDNMKKQQTHSQLSPASQNHKQQYRITKIVQIMQDVIRMFQSDRSVLILKIEELLLQIAAYDRKEREYFQRKRQFELQLSIAHEQLVIFKRLKKTK